MWILYSYHYKHLLLSLEHHVDHIYLVSPDQKELHMQK